MGTHFFCDMKGLFQNASSNQWISIRCMYNSDTQRKAANMHTIDFLYSLEC